jgi:hypothetical protein
VERLGGSAAGRAKGNGVLASDPAYVSVEGILGTESMNRFCAGQRKLASPVKPDREAEKDFDPNQFVGVEPKIVDGVVKVKVELKTRWVVEVIGSGGQVDLDLGEFPTYRDALYRSLLWSREHPNDLRLTREREVPVAGKK